MFSFVKNRKYSYILAGILFLFSILSPFILPFRQWIDLTGWVQSKYNVETGDIDAIMEQTKNVFAKKAHENLPEAEKKIIGDTMVYRVTGTNDFMVEVWVDESSVAGDTAVKTDLINSAKNHFFENLKSQYDATENKITQLQFVNIGASVGQYIKNSGYMALILVAIMISVYIMYAFSGAIPGMSSWPFAVVRASFVDSCHVIVFAVTLIG